MLFTDCDWVSEKLRHVPDILVLNNNLPCPHTVFSEKLQGKDFVFKAYLLMWV